MELALGSSPALTHIKKGLMISVKVWLGCLVLTSPIEPVTFSENFWETTPLKTGANRRTHLHPLAMLNKQNLTRRLPIAARPEALLRWFVGLF